MIMRLVFIPEGLTQCSGVLTLLLEEQSPLGQFQKERFNMTKL
jgi:hypothetical protein